MENDLTLTGIFLNTLSNLSLADSISIITSIGGLILAIIALIKYIKSIKEKDLEAVSTTLTNIAQLEVKLKDIPTGLKLHGIDLENLKNLGVTPQELAYLASSFTIGGTYYRKTSPIHDKNKEKIVPFAKNTYRYNMCVSRHMSKAWPEYRKLLDPSNYRDKIEKTMEYANKYVFVYGSLLSESSIKETLPNYNKEIIPAKLKGYKKAMSAVLPNFKSVESDKGIIPKNILYMNLEQKSESNTIGGLLKVSENDLLKFDKREITYNRIDITDEIELLTDTLTPNDITVIYTFINKNLEYDKNNIAYGSDYLEIVKKGHQNIDIILSNSNSSETSVKEYTRIEEELKSIDTIKTSNPRSDNKYK